MNNEDKNSIVNNDFNNPVTDKEFVSAEETVNSSSAPIFEEALKAESVQQSSFDANGMEECSQLNSDISVIKNEENGSIVEKNDKVSFIFQTCLIVVLISAFVLVITIFANKNSSIRAFLKPNPANKVVISEEPKEIQEEDNKPIIIEEEKDDNQEPQEENDSNVNEDENKNSSKKSSSKSKVTKKSESSTNSNSSSSSNNSSSSGSNSTNSNNGSSSNSNNKPEENNKNYDVTHFGYIDLDNNNNLRPSESIKRSLAAKWIIKLNGHEEELGRLSNTSCPFSDVNSSVDNYKYILAAYKLGYISGDNNSKYRPNEELTRAEAVVIILKALQIEGIMKESTGITRVYEDVSNQWYRDYIYQATDYGIIGGVSIGNGKYMFYPDRAVTRKEFIRMLYNAFNRNDKDLTCDGFPDNNPFNDIQATDKIYSYYLDGYATHYCMKK